MVEVLDVQRTLVVASSSTVSKNSSHKPTSSYPDKVKSKPVIRSSLQRKRRASAVDIRI